MTFERATAADVPALADLLNEAYLPAEAFLYDGPRTTVEEVASRMAKGVFLVLRAGRALEACVYVEPRGERGYVGMFGVPPRRQGTGAGPRAGARGRGGLARPRGRAAGGGRATEIFVRENGRWIHPGWHLDSGQ